MLGFYDWELHYVCSVGITNGSLQRGCVSGLPGTVHLNITLLRKHVKYIASSKRCIAFFPLQHLLMYKIGLTLETESSARKKTHCVVFALEGRGKASSLRRPLKIETSRQKLQMVMRCHYGIPSQCSENKQKGWFFLFFF